MKRIYPALFFLFLFHSSVHGQSSRPKLNHHYTYGSKSDELTENEPGYFGLSSIFMNNPLYGPNICVEGGSEGKLNDHFYLGGCGNLGFGNLHGSMGYNIKKPVYDLGMLGIILEYRMINRDFFKTNICLINEFLFYDLEDADSSHHSVDGHLHYKELASNSYYSPRLALSLQFGWVNLRFDYDLVFGKTSFGRKEDFENFGVFVGLRI